MKTLFNILQTVFLLVGTIIGAGFITGAELVGFLGGENFFSPLIFVVVLTMLVFAIVFRKINTCYEKEYTVDNLFGGTRMYKIATCFTSLVFSASMLAGIDALINTIVDLKGLQVGSLFTIIVVSIFSKHGVKGMEKLNLILMPIILITVNLLILTNHSVTFSNVSKFGVGSGVRAGLYVFMNLFVSVPVMRETAKGKSNKSLILISIVVAITVGLEAYLILNTIVNSGVNANSSMPLYFAMFNGKFSLTYFTLTLACSLTSAFSAYYPLYSFAKEKGGNYGIVVCAFVTVTISKLGLSGIIKYAYPIVGGLGALFFFKCFSCIKGKNYADNNRINLKVGENYVKAKKE